MEDIEKVKLFVLRELVKKRIFGGCHTPLEHVTRYLPDEFLNNKKGQKTIEKGIKELTNLGWILIPKKRTGKGSDIHISVNPRMIKEISAYLSRGLTQS